MRHAHRAAAQRYTATKKRTGTERASKDAVRANFPSSTLHCEKKKVRDVRSPRQHVTKVFLSTLQARTMTISSMRLINYYCSDARRSCPVSYFLLSLLSNWPDVTLKMHTKYKKRFSGISIDITTAIISAIPF